MVVAQMPPRDVVITTAELRELPSTITLVGTVEPLTRSLIGSEMAGIVSSMPVRQGDLVQAGTLIAKLNDDTVRYQLEEARASLKAEEARLRRWRFEVKRLERLYGREQANEKEVYEVQAEHDFAMYSVERRKAIVTRLETDLAKTEITAPFTGYVVRRETEVGEWIARGGSVVEIIDLGSVLVRVDVPEFALPFVREGNTPTVKIDALGRVFTGRVRHIIRQADAEAHTFPVEVVVDNGDQMLAGGMFARVTIVSGPTGKVVAVPKDAVVGREGVRYVGVVVPDGQGGVSGLLTAVTTGADIGDWIAITSGNIRPGGQVIIRGNEGLFPFPSPVRIVDHQGTPVMPHPKPNLNKGE